MEQMGNYPSLRDKRVFVTGGGSGIGEAIVQAFVEQGATVAFVDIAQQASEALCARLADAGPHAPVYRHCDITDIPALQRTMAELAAHCALSQRTLLRRFQEALGVSPVQYAQQLRVERAKALLETTGLSLEEITERCGYEDAATFSKVFKRWAALTPREYRQRFALVR